MLASYRPVGSCNKREIFIRGICINSARCRGSLERETQFPLCLQWTLLWATTVLSLLAFYIFIEKYEEFQGNTSTVDNRLDNGFPIWLPITHSAPYCMFWRSCKKIIHDWFFVSILCFLQKQTIFDQIFFQYLFICLA